MTIGEIPRFALGDDFSNFQEQLEMFFEANDAAGGTKRRVLLITALKKPAFSLLAKICAPNKPSEKQFSELCKLIEGHQNP